MHTTDQNDAVPMAAASTQGNRTGPTTRSALLMMALPAVLLTILIVGFAATQGGAPEEQAMRAALPYLIAVNHAIVFAVLLWVLRREGRSLRDLGWRLDRAGGSVAGSLLIAVAAALGLYLFKELVLDSIEAILAGNSPTFTSLFRFRPPADELALLTVATTLIAVEELVYRGYGLAALDARWSRGVAMGAMALLFGLLHWGNGPLAILFTGILGLGFGGLFLWRRSLLVPIVAHACYNALVILT